MKINSDFRDLLRSFNAAGVRYLIVGGYAVMVHTEPRYTKDLDLWIEPTESNARLVIAALMAFGAPTAGVTPIDFTEPEVFFQIGVDPVRVDIMTSVTGLDFVQAWSRRIVVDFGGESAPVLCREDVLKAKIASGRQRDRQDAKRLTTAHDQAPKRRRK
jgi:predicted nucleotidyltransferase